MLFAQLDKGSLTLDEIKQIAKHILEHKTLVAHLSDAQKQQLHDIVKPTLNADQNESEIRQLFDNLVKNFVIKTDKDDELRFYQDADTLYFGDEEGFKEAKTFHNLAEHPENIRRHFGL